MGLTDAQFDRIMSNWIAHKTPLSAGKIHRMLQYTINNYDSLLFMHYQCDNKRARRCNYLREQAVDKLGNLHIQFNEGKYILFGTILEIYTWLREGFNIGRLVDRILIDDKRYKDYKYNKEIYYIIERCENITLCNSWHFDIPPQLQVCLLANKNISYTNTFELGDYYSNRTMYYNINFHSTHYYIGKTLYYRAYVLHRLFLAKQLTMSDIMQHIGSYLIKLLRQ